MAYMKTRGDVAALRSSEVLENAMRRRDVNGRELARLAGVNRETVSRLRRRDAYSTATESALAVERVLRVQRGELFDYGDDTADEAATA